MKVLHVRVTAAGVSRVSNEDLSIVHINISFYDVDRNMGNIVDNIQVNHPPGVALCFSASTWIVWNFNCVV